ncbi:MAG: hypothetical protein H6619_02335 [Deltaproteobacteria bacterium]|nr:hypothetical protein [Deltaproteobacteria bacterium]
MNAISRVAAFLIDPNSQSRHRLKYAMSVAELFERIIQEQSLDEAKQQILSPVLDALKGANLSFFVYLSRRLETERMAAFIKEIKEKRQDFTIKFVLTVDGETKCRQKCIETGILVDADAMLFEPYSAHDISNVIKSCLKGEDFSNPESPIAWLIKDIISDLDEIVANKPSQNIAKAAMLEFRKRLAVLEGFDEKMLRKYYETAVEIFGHLEKPKEESEIQDYEGASERVKDMVEKRKSQALEKP